MKGTGLLDARRTWTPSPGTPGLHRRERGGAARFVLGWTGNAGPGGHLSSRLTEKGSITLMSGGTRHNRPHGDKPRHQPRPGTPAHGDPAGKALRLPSRAEGAGEPLGAAHASAWHRREVTGPAGVSSAAPVRRFSQPRARRDPAGASPPAADLRGRAPGGWGGSAAAEGSRAGREPGRDGP